MALQTALEVNLQSTIPIHADTAKVYKRLFAAFDQELANSCRDPSHPSCILHQRKNAEVLVVCIYRGQELRRFILHRYCIMPNHVHLLIEPLMYQVPADFELVAKWPAAGLSLLPTEQYSRDEAPKCHALEDIMGSLKANAARKINKIAGRAGGLFQKENFDHWIRYEAEYLRVIDYIDQNPVQANLCSNPADWRWSSAGEQI